MKREWLKELRKEKRISQDKIAELSEISQSLYGFIENGYRRPSVDVAKRIAKILKFNWVRFYESK